MGYRRPVQHQLLVVHCKRHDHTLHGKPAEFRLWFKDFLPKLKDKNFTFPVGEVSDRKDGKLVHLDGVNFSRAWNLYRIVEGMPELNHLKKIANEHINYSLPNLVGDSYEGGHWLGSFAIYALNSAKDD